MTTTMMGVLLAGLVLALLGGLKMIFALFHMDGKDIKSSLFFMALGVGLVFASAFDGDTKSFNFSKHERLYYQYYFKTLDATGLSAKWETLAPLEVKGADGDMGNGIHKCVDSHGSVTYTSESCASIGEAAAVESSSVNGQLVFEGTSATPAPGSNDKRSEASIVPRDNFTCDKDRIYCSQMTSCDEAMYFNKNCPGSLLDTDGDGIPCDKEFCGNNFSPMY